MKTAIISDTHFGDSNSVLVGPDGKFNTQLPQYKALIKAIGDKLDVLVLLGDIIDLSVASPDQAFSIAKDFFGALSKKYASKDKRLKLLYVPGNHDFDIWQNIEYEVNVIEKIKKGNNPVPFKGSVPGIIDISDVDNPIIDLPTIHSGGSKKLGEIFLKGLAKNLDFYVAYPNVYLKTKNETFLLTHGQYLEPVWSILGEVSYNALRKELKIKSNVLSIEQVVKMNLPLSRLTCSSLGQSGKLTPLIQKIEHDAKNREVEFIEQMLNKVELYIDKVLLPATWNPSTWLKESAYEVIASKVKNLIIDGIKGAEHTRYNELFLTDTQVRNRFDNYYKSSLLEINFLNQKHSTSLSEPSYFIFGHTHQPDGFNNEEEMQHQLPTGKIINILNTGGWVHDKAKTEKFKGAEVFLFDSNTQKIKSNRI